MRETLEIRDRKDALALRASSLFRIFNLVLLALASAPLLSGPSKAQTTAYAAGQGAYSPNDISLSIPVIASVGGRCGFATAPSGSHNEPNFDTHAWQKDFGFQLDCTGAFRVAVLSANGGLKTSGVVPAGYSTLAPYNVELHVVGNTTTTNSPVCLAGTLKAGSSCPYVGTASNTTGFFHAGPSTLQSGSYLRVSAAPYSGSDTLVSGIYADTLTVSVSAAL